MRLLIAFLCASCVQLSGQEIFNPEYVHRVDVFFSSAAYCDSLEANYELFLDEDITTYEPCDLILDGETVSSSGIRFKGQYSNFGFPGNKKPFKIDFNEFVSGQEFQHLKKLNLHNFAADPSFLREHLAYSLFRDQGIPASRTAYTALYINGAYWGLYLIVEEIDKTFIDRHFGSHDHTLYKCVSDTELEWRGWNDSLYHHQIKVEFDEGDHAYQPFLQFLDLFNNQHAVDFSADLNNAFNYAQYCRTLCLDVLLNNWDSYYDNGRNFSLYYDGTRMHWIPWDYNLCMWQSAAPLLPRDNSSDHYKPLLARIAENPLLREQYYASCCSVLNSIRVQNILAYTEHYHNMIAQYVQSDTLKFYTYADFQNNLYATVDVSMIRGSVPTIVTLPGINELLPARLSVLKKELFVLGYDCSDEDELHFDFSATPNPSTGGSIYITVWADAFSPEVHITMHDIYGRAMEDIRTTAVEDNRYRIDFPSPVAGEYVMTVTHGTQVASKKIVLLNQ